MIVDTHGGAEDYDTFANENMFDNDDTFGAGDPEQPKIGGNYRNYYDVNPMPMWKVFSLAMAMTMVLIVIVVVHVKRKARQVVRTISDDLTSLKLAEQGWVFYTRPGCPWCTKQLAACGGAYPAVVECNGSPDAAKKFPGALSCDDPKIVGFPFWYNTKTKDTRVGMQNEAALAALASVDHAR